MTLEHLGIAVRDADEAIALFTALLGTAPYKQEIVQREGVRTVFFGDGGAAGRAPKVELLEVTNPASPVARFLERRGPGIHHVAFLVDDLQDALDRARAAGCDVVSEPAAGADGKRVAFLHPRSAGGVLVELCEARPPVERADVAVEGGNIAVHLSGPPDAPAIVALHGILRSTAGDTAGLVRRWSADFRVLAVDLRGHGETTAAGPLSLEVLSNDLEAVFDAAGVARAHLFGFSLGAAVALYTAWRRPARVGRLAIVGTNVRWTEAEASAVTAAMATAIDEPTGRWARFLADTHGEDRWRGLIGDAIAFTRGLPRRHFDDDALRAVECPTLIVHGDRDAYFDLSHAVHLRRTLSDSRLWVAPGAGHSLQSFDEAALATAVAGFLGEDAA